MAGNSEVDVGSAVLSYRPAPGEEVAVAAERADVSVLYTALPWRTFRWHRGQRHYSGWYWAATQRDHVIHESRLELSCLMCADYVKTVRGMVAQPFMINASINGKGHHHIPDYLFATDQGPLVVDVTRRERLGQQRTKLLLEWTADVVHSLGWTYGVYTEPNPMALMNLRFLAGYRRDWQINPEIYAHLHAQATDLAGLTFGEAEQTFSEYPRPLVRSAFMHALWRHDFDVPIDKPLSPNTILEEPQ
jgi:hypothetical protein